MSRRYFLCCSVVSRPGPNNDNSFSRSMSRFAISSLTLGYSLRVISFSSSIRRVFRLTIPARVLPDDQGCVLKKSASCLCRSSVGVPCSFCPRFQTIKYPRFSFFLLPRTKSMTSCSAPLSTRSGFVITPNVRCPVGSTSSVIVNIS